MGKGTGSLGRGGFVNEVVSEWGRLGADGLDDGGSRSGRLLRTQIPEQGVGFGAAVARSRCTGAGVPDTIHRRRRSGWGFGHAFLGHRYVWSRGRILSWGSAVFGIGKVEAALKIFKGLPVRVGAVAEPNV